jgi:uridine kinase
MEPWARRGHDCGLNETIRSGRIKDVIGASLAAYEASLDEAAQKVVTRLNAGDQLRMMWVSGPSSSGKTTTTVKLTERLKRHGLRFLMLNLDDYFWSAIEHPTDWLNDRNYETPEALDIQLLNGHLRALLDGGTIEKPIYSFKEGRRVGTKPVKLEAGQILLLDCLHGFYPPITEGIDASAQFRIYIEAMNVLYEGDGSTKRLTQFTDARLIRRMLRDVKYRNHSALNTILHWHYVRYGELFSIIPLMGLADHVVNGGFPFDLPVLKPFLHGRRRIAAQAGGIRALHGFSRRAHSLRPREGAARIGGRLHGETAFNHDLIPGDAVIREFVGGSTIKIPHNE